MKLDVKSILWPALENVGDACFVIAHGFYVVINIRLNEHTYEVQS